MAHHIFHDQTFELVSQWPGILGLGSKRKPIIQKISEHVVAAVRLSGIGIAIGTLVGNEASELILNHHQKKMGKPKLLLLHGALGSMSEFDPLRGFLEPHFETLPFNFTGHGGRRIQPEGFTMTSMAAELYSWIIQENIFRPIIFGYSMGGYVALKCEAQHPGLIGHIITLGTKFDWSTESTDKQITGLDINTWRQKIPYYVSSLEKRYTHQMTLIFLQIKHDL